MTITLSSNISSAILTEVLARTALAPLRSRYSAFAFANGSNLDGLGTNLRRIPVMNSIPDAVTDTEGVSFNAFETQTAGTPVDMQPAPRVQGVEISVTSLRQFMAGMTRAQVIDAARLGNPALVPLLQAEVENLLHAHLRPMEGDVLALFPSLTLSAGVTNTGLSALTIVGAQLSLFDQDPEPETRNPVMLLSMKGITDLRYDTLGGSLAGSEILGGMGGYSQQFLDFIFGTGGMKAPATVNPTGALPPPAGEFLGMPVIQCNSSKMATANAGVDQVGAIVIPGYGETGAPGSMRGCYEVALGHDFGLDLFHDIKADSLQLVARWASAAQIHTQAHGLKLIYKKS